MHKTVSSMLGGGGGGVIANQFSLFQLHWSNAVQPNLIRHHFNGLGKETIGAMKLHQYFEFGPASQDPFPFCQIQLALDTV